MTQSATGWLLANSGEDDWDDKEEVKVKHKGSLPSAHNLSLNPSEDLNVQIEKNLIRQMFKTNFCKLGLDPPSKFMVISNPSW